MTANVDRAGWRSSTSGPAAPPTWRRYLVSALAALPRIDGHCGVDDLADGVAGLVGAVGAAWTHPAAPPVRLLPTVLAYQDLPLRDPRPEIPIGIAELDLGPVWLDLRTDPHFLVYGEAGCGKSAFLRAFARSIVARTTPHDAKIVLIDYRRSLLGSVTGEHLLAYGTAAPRADEILTEVAQVMRGRLPGADVTTQQPRDRSWWRGPQLYVLVDDYELVAAASGNPMAHLLDCLGQARDIGLHVIIARRSGGAARAMYEPVTLNMRETGSAGLVLSTDREDGVLLGGVKPASLPPGRGWLVTRRGGPQLIQLALLDPAPEVTGSR